MFEAAQPMPGHAHKTKQTSKKQEHEEEQCEKNVRRKLQTKQMQQNWKKIEYEKSNL